MADIHMIKNGGKKKKSTSEMCLDITFNFGQICIGFQADSLEKV